MRNREEEGIPLVNIERNPLVIIVFTAISAVIGYYGFSLLKDVNPIGFLVMMPAALFAFQTLWLLLHPFAIVYENKITIRQSLMHHKDHYYIDIKTIAIGKKGKVFITYKDDEVEKLKLFGIKTDHIPLLKNEVEKYIVLPVA